MEFSCTRILKLLLSPYTVFGLPRLRGREKGPRYHSLPCIHIDGSQQSHTNVNIIVTLDCAVDIFCALNGLLSVDTGVMRGVGFFNYSVDPGSVCY